MPHQGTVHTHSINTCFSNNYLEVEAYSIKIIRSFHLPLNIQRVVSIDTITNALKCYQGKIKDGCE